MQMLVFKWDDDLAVELPKELVDRLGLKEGDELNVVAAGDSTVEVETKEMQRQRALGRDEANEQ